MAIPDEGAVPQLAQRLAAYPELWQVVSAQVRQPHFLAHFVATLQPVEIANFAESPAPAQQPAGFLAGVLYFEVALALEPFVDAPQAFVAVFEREAVPSQTKGGVLLAPGAPLAVALRVMAEPIEPGPCSHICLDFYAHVIAVCIDQRNRHQPAGRAAARLGNWLRRKMRKPGPLEQHRMAWDAGELDHIQAFAHYQRARHARAVSDDAQADLDQCVSIAARAQAGRDAPGWAAECLAAAGGTSATTGNQFTMAIGGSPRSIPVFPWIYRINDQ